MEKSIKSISAIQGIGIYNGSTSFPADVREFKKFNLIYGFNGAGKTSLTRVLRSIEIGTFPEGLSNVQFKINLDDNTAITQSNITDPDRPDIKVFNTDFVWDNIKWNSGNKSANAFYYIGKGLKDADEKIKKLETELKEISAKKLAIKNKGKGSLDIISRSIADATGSTISRMKEMTGLIEISFAEGKFNALLTDELKSNPDLCLLSKEEFEVSKSVVQNVKEPETIGEHNISQVPIKFNDFMKKVVQACKKDFVSEKIEELEEHQSEQDWAERGLNYHNCHSLEKCLLCGNFFTEERRKKLSDHLNESYKELKNEVEDLISDIAAYKKELETFSMLTDGDKIKLSPECRGGFDKNENSIKEKLISLSRAILVNLETELINKQKNLGIPKDITGNAYADGNWATSIEEISNLASDLKSIIKEHNDNVGSFKENRQKHQKKVKNHFAAEFYKNNSQNIVKKTELEEEFAHLEGEMTTKESEKEALKQGAKDYLAPIPKINELIKNYLGHEAIQFRERDDGELGYELSRNGTSSKLLSYLSEGEKTAVAFCYFIAQLENGNEFDKKNSIVVIDDPISSLDSKSLYTAFAFLKEHLRDAGQVFLLTHNFLFFKQMKGWLFRIGKLGAQKVKDSWGIENTKGKDLISFYNLKVFVSQGRRLSILSELPQVLKDNTSEYHYLYLQVVQTANGMIENNLLMPNAIRRVLESFLSLKSDEKSFYDQFKKVVESIPAGEFSSTDREEVDKFINKYSHANSDALFTLDEAYADDEVVRKVAQSSLNFIKFVDPLHYDAMNSLIGQKGLMVKAN